VLLVGGERCLLVEAAAAAAAAAAGAHGRAISGTQRQCMQAAAPTPFVCTDTEQKQQLQPTGAHVSPPVQQAFVDFETYEEASKAMREKDHKVFNEKFGDRYVRLIQVC
jgi:hypothetical protein